MHPRQFVELLEALEPPERHITEKCRRCRLFAVCMGARTVMYVTTCQGCGKQLLYIDATRTTAQEDLIAYVAACAHVHELSQTCDKCGSDELYNKLKAAEESMSNGKS